MLSIVRACIFAVLAILSFPIRLASLRRKNVSVDDTTIWPLLPIQKEMGHLLPVIEAFCSLAAILLRRRKLTARENTQRCYEQFFDPLCADTNVWPDYTEGHYPTGMETYDQAKLNQFDYIFDKMQVKPGTKIMDIGCGNGNLLLRARERGCEPHGITVSRSQMQRCSAAGLHVKVCSFQSIPQVFAPGTFDYVVMNGPTEHFVTEEDVLAGRKRAIQDEIFHNACYLLKPGGRLFITCIHFRSEAEVARTVESPLRSPVGSTNFFYAVLVQLYSGWYPTVGEYDRASENNSLHLIFERDATEDYYITSRIWGRKLRGFLAENPKFRLRFASRLFWNDPRYFFICFLYYYYDAWTWQFRPAPETPLIHRWLMFEKQHSKK